MAISFPMFNEIIDLLLKYETFHRVKEKWINKPKLINVLMNMWEFTNNVEGKNDEIYYVKSIRLDYTRNQVYLCICYVYRKKHNLNVMDMVMQCD